MNEWYTDSKTNDGVIISTRIRLARNYEKFPYLIMLNNEDAKRVIDTTLNAVKKSEVENSFHYIDIEQQDEINNRILQEKHLISPEFLSIKKPRGLLLKHDESVSVMINEEDHIRIQTIFAGDNIKEAWDLANRIDDVIEEKVEYAFDKDFGYLTSCPTNTGTGLRASFMLHIPLLEKSGQLKNLIQAISKFGMTVRGIYGEGSEPLGCIYQISNQVTLGKSENEIINGLKNVTNQVIEREMKIREKTFQNKKWELEDMLYRSYGTLAHCKKLGINEGMNLLSDVRLGFIANVIQLPRPKLNIYDIMKNIQLGNLQKLAGKELNENERDIFRAKYVNDLFGCK